jgi:hypothetical protein
MHRIKHVDQSDRRISHARDSIVIQDNRGYKKGDSTGGWILTQNLSKGTKRRKQEGDGTKNMELESAATASTTATDESSHSTRSTATTTVTVSLLQQQEAAAAAVVVVVSKSSATTTDLDPSQFSRDTTRHPGFYQQQQHAVTKSTNLLPMVRFFGCLDGWRSNKVEKQRFVQVLRYY